MARSDDTEEEAIYRFRPPQAKAKPKQESGNGPHLEWEGKKREGFQLPPTRLQDAFVWDMEGVLNHPPPHDAARTGGPHGDRALGTQQTLDLVTARQAETKSHPPFNSKPVELGAGQHNRLVYGDSLLAMHALLLQGQAGQVQMAYMDPPYGINFNAQLATKGSVAEGYNDTWASGLGSFLEHLRERFLLLKELLTPSGSLFVQIGQQNLHYVRCLLDEIFGAENCVNLITFRTAISTNNVSNIADHLLWYAKDKAQALQRQLYADRPLAKRLKTFTYTESGGKEGEFIKFKPQEVIKRRSSAKKKASRAPHLGPLVIEGTEYTPPPGYEWRWDAAGMARLNGLGRLAVINGKVYGKRYEADFPKMILTNVWTDTATSTFAARKHYSVHTNPKVIRRCMAMTTRPGDLVFDPTSGSGTTAFVAEELERRWIAADTSPQAIQSAMHWLCGSLFDQCTWDRQNQDFQYAQAPKVSLSNLARGKECPPIDLYDSPAVLAPKSRVCSPFVLSVVSLDANLPAGLIAGPELLPLLLSNGIATLHHGAFKFDALAPFQAPTGKLPNTLPQESLPAPEMHLEFFLNAGWEILVGKQSGATFLVLGAPYAQQIDELGLSTALAQIAPGPAPQGGHLILVLTPFQLSLGGLRMLYPYRQRGETGQWDLSVAYIHPDLVVPHLDHSSHPEAVCLGEWAEFSPVPSPIAGQTLQCNLISLGKTQKTDQGSAFISWGAIEPDLSDRYFATSTRKWAFFNIPGYAKYTEKSLKKKCTNQVGSFPVWKSISELSKGETQFHVGGFDPRGIFHYGFIDFGEMGAFWEEV